MTIGSSGLAGAGVVTFSGLVETGDAMVDSIFIVRFLFQTLLVF